MCQPGGSPLQRKERRPPGQRSPQINGPGYTGCSFLLFIAIFSNNVKKMSCSQPEPLFQEFLKKLFVKHFFLSIWEIKNGEDWLKSTLAEEEVEEHLGDSMKDDEGEF